MQRGDAIDRFTVLEHLGEGGMGVVVSAYDPSLDRKVAIKVLRPDRLPMAPEEGRMRLLREAQAMARLSHPNVITVYEVGTVDDQVFVAMELVEGETLGAWLARERPWREVVKVFLEAGRGLAAAHRAGLVHRDFKPDNVLVGVDGSARVTDFGLAGVSGGSPTTADAGALAVPITRTGTIFGTPAYMAPEQHRGTEADARADQFSFCVALYEGLHRVRPFAGKTAAEIRDAIVAWQIAPSTAEVPRWLRAAVLRGMSPEPADRWPSMDVLLHALAHDPAATRRAWLVRGALVAAAVAAAAVLVARGDREACPGAADKVAEVWNAGVRARVRTALLATGKTQASDVARRVEEALDRRFGGWAGARTEACRATRVRGEQSEAMLDLRMQCLERARRQMQALLEVWQKQVDINQAVQAALTVGDVAACADTESLATPVPAPRDSDQLRRLDEVKRKLDGTDARRRAGQLQAALALAREAVLDARGVSYAPIVAEALHRNGELEIEVGKLEIGIALLYEAVRVGSEARDDVRVARVLRDLLFYTGVRAKRLGEAAGLWTVAEAAVARAGNHDDLVAELLSAQGSVLHEQGRSTEALDYLGRALAFTEKLRGPEHPDVARLLQSLANAHHTLGRWDEGIALIQRALAIWRHSLGEEHPSTAAALNNLCGYLQEKQDMDAAAAACEQSIAIREKVYPPDHPAIAGALNNLANVRYYQERNDEAWTLYERAVRIEEQAYGPEHLRTLQTRGNLANVAARRGDTAGVRRLIDSILPAMTKAYGDEHPALAQPLTTLATALLRDNDTKGARAAYARALAIVRKQGPDHPDTAFPLRGLGEVDVAEGRYADAIARFEQAKAILEKEYAPDHVLLGPVLADLGQAHLEAGHPTIAVELLERAVSIAQARGVVDGVESARERFQLARALWATGRRRRAVELAQGARDSFARVPLGPERDETGRWLDRHSIR